MPWTRVLPAERRVGKHSPVVSNYRQQAVLAVYL
jgi:hypothetical protein